MDTPLRDREITSSPKAVTSHPEIGSRSHHGPDKTMDKLLDLADKLPPERLRTYARLWQFETWLRTMVYVEFRARYGDSWISPLNIRSDKPYENDKRLSHMPTRETLPISYMQLTDLLETISVNWCLFKTYLPPRDLWVAKLDEISQIRHRVAHFRFGHEDDLPRVKQLLRDLDKGFWRFCTSYNSTFPVLPPSDDKVMHISHILTLSCGLRCNRTGGRGSGWPIGISPSPQQSKSLSETGSVLPGRKCWGSMGTCMT